MFSQAKVLGNYLASVLMWWMNNLSVLAFSLESTGYISGSPGAEGGEESGGLERTYLSTLRLLFFEAHLSNGSMFNSHVDSFKQPGILMALYFLLDT